MNHQSLALPKRSTGSPYVPGLVRRVATAPKLSESGFTLGNYGHELSKINIVAPVPSLQAKLTISQPGDASELEAESVARQVANQQENVTRAEPFGGFGSLSTGSPFLVQRKETSFPEDAEEKIDDEKGQVQRKGACGVSTSAVDLGQTLSSRAGGGQPLPETAKGKMQSSFGVSFDKVRIHTDNEAVQLSRSLAAEAFTYGNDIYFDSGKFDSSTRAGTELLAHELTHTIQQGGVGRRAVQRRGGATVGQLSINSNVISAGLTAGHAWLAYTPVGGSMTTYGTWGNRTPIGLHRNLELGYSAAATRTTPLDSGDFSSLTSFAAANNAWGYINNCASFAARGWQAVTSESLSYKSLGIPNPSALGAGIFAANGGATGTLPATTTATTGSSSSL